MVSGQPYASYGCYGYARLPALECLLNKELVLSQERYMVLTLLGLYSRFILDNNMDYSNSPWTALQPASIATLDNLVATVRAWVLWTNILGL